MGRVAISEVLGVFAGSTICAAGLLVLLMLLLEKIYGRDSLAGLFIECLINRAKVIVRYRPFGGRP